MQPQLANTAPNQPPAARHAQVVPSFVLPSLSRTLECWAGTVSPGELVRWERPADLAESARRELRNVVIKRLRPRSDWLWAQAISVRLVDGWRDRLTASDARGINAVLAQYADKPFEHLTLGEFRQGFGAVLAKQLDAAERKTRKLSAQLATARERYAGDVIAVRALEATIALVNPTVNPTAGGVVSVWAGKYGERGAFRQFVLGMLKAAAPQTISSAARTRLS